METVFESMKKSLAAGDRIELRGFGVFNVRPRKTGIGRNPRTGAEVSIPPGKAVRFKPGRNCSPSTRAGGSEWRAASRNHSGMNAVLAIKKFALPTFFRKLANLNKGKRQIATPRSSI